MSEVRHTILYANANKRSFLEKQKYRLQSDIRTLLLKQKNKLALIEKNIETHSPSFMLERGYTITTVNGKRLSTITEIHKTDKIKTYLADGYFESDVTEKHPL
jgi:exodeoxyribonuclease VII large subunit